MTPSALLFTFSSSQVSHASSPKALKKLLALAAE